MSNQYLGIATALIIMGIVLHGSLKCPDTKRAREYFDNNDIQYEWHDVDSERSSAAFVLKANGLKESFPFTIMPKFVVKLARRVLKTQPRIPVIVFSDGSVLIEPTNEELEKKTKLLKSENASP